MREGVAVATTLDFNLLMALKGDALYNPNIHVCQKVIVNPERQLNKPGHIPYCLSNI